MPGGDKEAYAKIEPVLNKIAAKTDDGACVTYVGEGSAGHYVKMVHNGIEYGIMQVICEIYDIFRKIRGHEHGGNPRSVREMDRFRHQRLSGRNRRRLPGEAGRSDGSAAGRSHTRYSRAKGHRQMDGSVGP